MAVVRRFGGLLCCVVLACCLPASLCVSPLRGTANARDVYKELLKQKWVVRGSNGTSASSVNLQQPRGASVPLLPAAAVASNVPTAGLDEDQVEASLPTALKRPPPSCFGYGRRQRGKWTSKGEWTSEKKNVCDINDYWDFFEDKDTAKAVVRCWARRRWVTFAGDANTREAFQAVLSRMEALDYKYSFVSGDSRDKHGDSLWSDRDAIFEDTNIAGGGSFRLSFRFFKSPEAFDQHWRDWNLLLEGDGTTNTNIDLKFIQARKRFEASYGITKPDTLIMSTGLWDVSCKAAANTYKILQKEESSHELNDVLYFTAPHVKWHRVIKNDQLGRARDCVMSERSRMLFNTSSTAAAPLIFDAFELTANLPTLDWIGQKGGYYVFADGGKPTPVGKAIVAAWNSFACN